MVNFLKFHFLGLSRKIISSMYGNKFSKNNFFIIGAIDLKQRNYERASKTIQKFYITSKKIFG